MVFSERERKLKPLWGPSSCLSHQNIVKKKEKNIFFLVNSSLTLWLLFCSEKAPTSRGMEACWNCGFWYALLDFLKLLAKIWIWSYIIFCSIFNTITCLFERNERENDIYKLSVKQPIYKLYSDNYGWFFGRNLGGSLLLDLLWKSYKLIVSMIKKTFNISSKLVVWRNIRAHNISYFSKYILLEGNWV